MDDSPNNAEQPTLFQKAETYLNENRNDPSTQDYKDVIATYNIEAAKLNKPVWSTSFLPPADPMADMGFVESIQESFTGTARETDSTRTLPSYTKMPELNQLLSADAWQSAGGLMQGAPDEMAQIITAQFPDVQMRQDEKGNYIFKSSQDGKDYVIKPGFGEGDLTRFAGQTLLMAPATAVTGAAAVAGAPALPLIAVGAGLYGLSSLGYQLYQKSIGGQFNALDIAMDAFAPAGIESALLGLKTAAQNVMPVIKSTWSKATNKFRPPEEVGTLANKTDDEIQVLFNKAKDGDIDAQQELAELGKTDLDVIAAAEKLGIGEYLQPDHVSTDSQFIELMQLIKSWKGSEARKEELIGLQKLGDEVVEAVEAAGAQTPGDMSRTVYTRLQDKIDSLGAQADKLWTNFRTATGIDGASDVATVTFTPETLLTRIQTKLARNNNNESLLQDHEKDFLKIFSPKEIKNKKGEVVRIELPTLDMFESFRRKLTEGMGQKGSYMNESTGSLRKFYGDLLDEERKAVQENFGADVLTDFDLARKTSELRFGSIDDQISIFGKKASEYLGGSLDQGMRLLSKGDAQAFLKYMNAIPEEDRANVLMTGLKMQFGNSTKTGKLNFNTFSKWYESVLAEKEAYGVLKKYLPSESLDMFNNIYRVSSSINKALQERVYTGASMQLTDLLTAEGVMSGVYDLAKNVGKLGAAEAVASTVVGLPGAAIAAALIRSMGTTKPSRQVAEEAMKAADNLLLSPAFMNMVKDQYTGESIRRFGLSAGWQNFARKVGISPEAANAGEFVRSIRTATIQAVEAPKVMTEETEETLVAPPQASVPKTLPAAPQTRGVPGLTEPADAGAPPSPVSAPAPQAVAQGPSQSREMMDRLFPMDIA